MAKLCPTATLVGESEISGFELFFRGDGHGCYATIEPLDGCAVPVRVWALQQSDELALDEYERFPELYRKDWVELNLADGSTPAMVYLMNDGYEFGAPAESYLRIILDAYAEADFPRGFLTSAVEKSVELARASQPVAARGSQVVPESN